jgi:hypothetical protein
MSIVRRGSSGSASSLADATDRPLGGAHVRRGPAHVGASAGRCADADGGPLLYTVQEAADRLHIGRTLAYQQTERYLATGGSDGIPAIRIGNCLRVPRPGLLMLAFTGRVASPSELESYVNRLVRRSSRPTRIVIRRATRAAFGAAADRGRRPSTADRTPGKARRSPAGRRAKSAEQLRLLPGE